MDTYTNVTGLHDNLSGLLTAVLSGTAHSVALMCVIAVAFLLFIEMIAHRWPHMALATKLGWPATGFFSVSLLVLALQLAAQA